MRAFVVKDLDSKRMGRCVCPLALYSSTRQQSGCPLLRFQFLSAANGQRHASAAVMRHRHTCTWTRFNEDSTGRSDGSAADMVALAIPNRLWRCRSYTLCEYRTSQDMRLSLILLHTVCFYSQHSHCATRLQALRSAVLG